MTGELHETGGGNPQAPTTLSQRNRAARKEEFLAILKEEGTITAACARTGYAPSTVYRWRDADPAFNEACETWLYEELEDVVAGNMYRIAISDDPRQATASVKAGEFLLKAFNRTKYGDQTKIESTQTVNHMVQVVHTVRDDLRARQLERLSQLKTIDEEKK